METFTPCPVCGDTGWSVGQLQLHVESHFAGPPASSKAKRKKEEEAEFASLQAKYGMDKKGNFRSQSTSGLRKAVVSGQLSVVDYYEHTAGLAESQKSDVDDIHPKNQSFWR